MQFIIRKVGEYHLLIGYYYIQGLVSGPSMEDFGLGEYYRGDFAQRQRQCWNISSVRYIRGTALRPYGRYTS
jgi:hypothetical protein